jgi:hypothetical protein
MFSVRLASSASLPLMIESHAHSRATPWRRTGSTSGVAVVWREPKDVSIRQKSIAGS